MAKRKRLTPADPAHIPTLETQAAPGGWAGLRRPPAPIADMAGAASATAALEDLAQEMQQARSDGRMVVSLPLDKIDATYLVRDRTAFDETEMKELMASLAARGQQAPIEVVATGADHYGLISGWRRLSALRRLQAETGDTGYGQVKCLLRSPETASEAYLSMVEENEIRAPLSFYERAHVAAKAAEQGAFATPREAVKVLFAAVSPSKRSKIHSFGVLYAHLDSVLRFAREIPEHLGLALAKALETQEGFAERLRAALAKAAPSDAATERAVLEQVLKGQAVKTGTAASNEAMAPDEVAPGVHLLVKKGRLVLSGAGVDAALAEALRGWVAQRSGK